MSTFKTDYTLVHQNDYLKNNLFCFIRTIESMTTIMYMLDLGEVNQNYMN